MKVLFNCTTNVKGGTSTNAANFILASAKQKSHIDFYYAVSLQVYRLISIHNIDESRITLFDSSPSKSTRARNKLKRLEIQIDPDLTFTLAGPAYVRFRSNHLMGCSNPYIIFASFRDILFGRTWLSSIFCLAQTYYQKYYVRMADFYLFQSDSSMATYLKDFSPKGRCYVVPNSLGLEEDRKETDRSVGIRTDDERRSFEVLCPSEDYPHKGLHILPALCRLLDWEGYRVKFIVTNSKQARVYNTSNVESKMLEEQASRVQYIGPVNFRNMPSLYSSTDIVFMPSVLEVFSSVCLEALYFKKPLVVANRSFNREIASDFAFYCDPESMSDCCRTLISAFKSVNDHSRLEGGRSHVLQKYGRYDSRYTRIVEIIHSIITEEISRGEKKIP